MLDPQSIHQLRQLDSSVRRSFDADEVNRIINDPNVLPHVGMADHIDLADVVANPANVLLMTEGGAIFFMMDEPGIYEVHTSFLKGFRGKHAIDASLQAYRWMFTHTDCMSIVTRIPGFNKPAAMAARVVGFVPRFERKDAWPTKNGNVDLRFYELTYADWLAKARDALIAAGREFHAHLEGEMARHGKPEKPHPDEDCHDHYVGACTEMVYGGQPEKGVVLYNRWARLAGYGSVGLIARSPLVIDIGTAVLLIQDRTFRILKCRSAG